MSRSVFSPSQWSHLNIEGDDHDSGSDSDGDSGNGASSPALSALTSPASKRARKRAKAAQNKREKEAAKLLAAGGQPGLLPPQNGKQAKSRAVEKSKATDSGPATTEDLPEIVPPTFVQDPVEPKLDEPFIQASKNGVSETASSTSAASSNPSAVLQQDTAQDADSSTAADTEDEEDMSLLVDDESSSSSDEEEQYADQSGQTFEKEPETPRAPTQADKPKPSSSDAISSIKAASAALKSKVGESLQAVADARGVPNGVSSLAERAAKSDIIQEGKEERKEEQAVAQQQYGTDHDPTKKWKAIMTRTVWTLIMIVGFVGLVLMGHVYLIILVIICQALVFKEISALFDVAAKPIHTHREHKHTEPSAVSPSRAARDARVKAERERWSKVLSWYFFAAINYFLHGETIIYYFKHIVFVDAYFIPFARHHRFISFMLYVLGFVGFVTNLKRNQLRRQFDLFCWIHMSLLLIVVSSHFIVNNILEGIIWFWLPASEVVMNDIAAYVWGMLFGRTQLIKLSPKKTVEGFVGAFFSTVVFGYVWATIFMRYPYMICPATDLGTNAFSNLVCQPNDVFEWRSLVLPETLSTILSVLLLHPMTRIPWAPFQLHAIVMAVFASLVAPFGGFFASGFKRAFNVKDFGDSIPGHGGMTDRMDCQFLMGLFAYVYYSSIIRDNHVTVGGVMQTIVSSLSQQDQVELAKALTGYLAQQGLEWR